MSFKKAIIKKPDASVNDTNEENKIKYPSDTDEVTIAYKILSGNVVLEQRGSFKIQLGRQRLSPVLEEAVKTMEVSEAALFIIPYKSVFPLGRPTEDSTSSHSEDITFEVNLLECQEYIKSKYEMTAGELSTFAENQKKLGVEAFSKGSYYDAISKFEEAAAYLSTVPSADITQDVKTLLCSLLVNMASSYNKLLQFSSSVVKATQALQYKANPKAYYLRAMAYASLGNSELIPKAFDDYHTLQTLLPQDDPGVLSLFSLICSKRDEYTRSERSLFKKAFKKGNVYDDLKSWTIPNEINPKNPFIFMDINLSEQADDSIRLEIELFEDCVPMTCKNFLGLCEDKKFKNSIFHRLRKGFRIEGGDFEFSNGTGGKSIYGKDFKDENFKYKHTQRGLLSMLNNGADTNSSQFCIMFDASELMDGKNVVFGRVIGGFESITKLEEVGCDEECRPLKEIRIVDCGVLDKNQ